MFSVGWDVCIFFHFVEEQLRVPYRFYKDFVGEAKSEGSTALEKWEMYVRDLEINVENAFDEFGKRVEAAGLCRQTGADSLKLKCVDMKALFNYTKESLQDNKNCLVSMELSKESLT